VRVCSVFYLFRGCNKNCDVRYKWPQTHTHREREREREREEGERGGREREREAHTQGGYRKRPLCTRICPYSFFKVTPPGATPGPPVKSGARVRRFRGCKISALNPLFEAAAAV